MKKSYVLLVFFLTLILLIPAFSQTKVKDLKFHHLQNYCWMRLAEIVPEVTDRAILAIGTVEAHGAVALGADNFIPQHIAEMIWERCNFNCEISSNYLFNYTCIFPSKGW